MPAEETGGGNTASALRIAALDYATRAPVFPCVPGGKQPLTPRGFKDATKDLEQVAIWWRVQPEANIGLAIPEDLAVIDVDPRNGGAVPAQLPRTRMASTAGGGYHLYFRIPRTARLRGQMAPGVDVKRGGKGYVLLPPSSIAGAGAYAWKGNGREPIAALPRSVIRELTKPKPKVPTPAGDSSLLPFQEGTPWGLAARERQLGRLAIAPNGQRNDALNRAAFELGQLVAGGELRQDETLHQLLFVAERIGLDPDEALGTIRSGFEAGLCKPRGRGG